MPGQRQKTVTIPLDLWQGFIAEFEKRPEYWRGVYNVKSPTGLMVFVARRGLSKIRFW